MPAGGPRIGRWRSRCSTAIDSRTSRRASAARPRVRLASAAAVGHQPVRFHPGRDHPFRVPTAGNIFLVHPRDARAGCGARADDRGARRPALAPARVKSRNGAILRAVPGHDVSSLQGRSVPGFRHAPESRLLTTPDQFIGRHMRDCFLLIWPRHSRSASDQLEPGEPPTIVECHSPMPEGERRYEARISVPAADLTRCWPSSGTSPNVSLPKQRSPTAGNAMRGHGRWRSRGMGLGPGDRRDLRRPGC